MISKIMGKIENKMFSASTNMEQMNLIFSFFVLLFFGCVVLAGALTIIENLNTLFREIALNGVWK